MLHLNNTENEYTVGSSEWSDGSRSDLVLGPRGPTKQLPPIIIEVEQSVDKDFIKRVNHYCLQAYNKYKCDPLVLIICVDKLSTYVMETKTPSSVTDCHSFPSNPWAKDCLIVSKINLEECNHTPPLDRFVTLGLFFIYHAKMPVEAECRQDHTIKRLYELAHQYIKARQKVERFCRLPISAWSADTMIILVHLHMKSQIYRKRRIQWWRQAAHAVIKSGWSL
ncbi:uncharacterized protein BYT42DRAFT_494984 [Radiomyces spectabilis]|uniref:uncharacterized protein n=1 Tax=Radiomyces spectabilis TaxID=64574 RepID=UPI00221E3F1A|nr:uncharacterized protein BYT42DRAFT_494984 [Radiomyces spectabilis]KAI8381038.1 hypothetical protein BYT42DRAFT_494984 [Radiomyces spectabilis]